MDQKDTDYPEGFNEAPEIDEQALPVEFTNVVEPESEDVDVVNNQEPEPDEDEEA